MNENKKKKKIDVTRRNEIKKKKKKWGGVNKGQGKRLIGEFFIPTLRQGNLVATEILAQTH